MAFGKGWLEPAFQVIHVGELYIFIININLTISSSKSFEEESPLSIMDDENLEMKLVEPPSRLLVCLGTLKTLFMKP